MAASFGGLYEPLGGGGLDLGGIDHTTTLPGMIEAIKVSPCFLAGKGNLQVQSYVIGPLT